MLYFTRFFCGVTANANIKFILLTRQTASSADSKLGLNWVLGIQNEVVSHGRPYTSQNLGHRGEPITWPFPASHVKGASQANEGISLSEVKAPVAEGQEGNLAGTPQIVLFNKRIKAMYKATFP